MTSQSDPVQSEHEKAIEELGIKIVPDAIRLRPGLTYAKDDGSSDLHGSYSIRDESGTVVGRARCCWGGMLHDPQHWSFVRGNNPV